MILIKKDILLTKYLGYKQNHYFCVMSILKKILNFYIYASIHVALAVYSFVRITEIYFGLEYNEALDYFAFYGTITGYNFVKYFGLAKFHHRSLTQNLKIIQIFSFVCFLLMCYYGFQLSLNTLFLFGGFGLLTVLYAIPFLSGFQKNLRNISYLKIIVVAVVWAGVTVIVPIFDAGESFETHRIILQFAQRFLLVCVLILPFDIRDLSFDAVSLQTIPRKIGVDKTKKLGYVLLLFTLVLEFLISPEANYRNVFLGVFFILLFLLMRATAKQSKYYSSFWVELVPVFWSVVLYGIINF
jgi:hypothetical protein